MPLMKTETDPQLRSKWLADLKRHLHESPMTLLTPTSRMMRTGDAGHYSNEILQHADSAFVMSRGPSDPPARGELRMVLLKSRPATPHDFDLTLNAQILKFDDEAKPESP